MLPSLLVAVAAWASPSLASTSTCILSNLDSSSPVCANLPPALSSRKAPAGDKYLIGVGKADITGPVVELSLAGYGKFDQNGSGLRQRLYSRAFIVASRSNPKDRIAYLVLDDLAGDTAVRYGVLDAMSALGGEYAAYYNAHSVALTATHTHSGPGGWFNYLLPQAPTLGLDLQSYKAIVDGAALSIQRAHDSLEEGYLDLATVEVPDAAINRSPSAYLMNPKEERDKYETSVDTTMTVLRFQRARDSKSIGLLNWFPVHGTSIYNNNTHVAGDNKGVAAWLVEQAMKADDSAAEGFVAGFSQGNEGDASPNTEGAWCEDGSNARCDMGTSACADGYSEKCKARGPEFRTNDAGVKSCYEIGRRQYAGAKKAYDAMEAGTATPIRGRVAGFHFFQDMSQFNFTLPNGTPARTCGAGLGYSTAAGTTDGEGLGGFVQSTTTSSKLPRNAWAFFFKTVGSASADLQECHAPKPVLLDASRLSKPYRWEPNKVDVQVLRIGQVVVAVSPSEITTMAGRRWRDALAKGARQIFGTGDGKKKGDEIIPLVAGPANTYAHYVTTFEEYAAQRYEGASTMYGPHQLSAYINLTVGNLHHLGDSSDSLPVQVFSAEDNRGASLSFYPGVWYDSKPRSKRYGQAITQPKQAYKRGEVVKATFQAANPRNNLRLEDTYAAVEMLVGGKRWARVLDDEDWFLVFTWRRTSLVLGQSEADVAWETNQDVEPGVYRLRYYGDAKKMFGGVESFEGASEPFRLD